MGKTGATGQRLEEAKGINLSLSALGNCINALTDSKARDSPAAYRIPRGGGVGCAPPKRARESVCCMLQCWRRRKERAKGDGHRMLLALGIVAGPARAVP